MNILHEYVLYNYINIHRACQIITHMSSIFNQKLRADPEQIFFGGGGMSEEYFDQFAS